MHSSVVRAMIGNYSIFITYYAKSDYNIYTYISYAFPVSFGMIGTCLRNPFYE